MKTIKEKKGVLMERVIRNNEDKIIAYGFNHYNCNTQ